MREIYEFDDGETKKFWEPEVQGNELVVRFGKPDTGGRIHIKKYSSPEKTRKEYNKLVRKKLTHGYKPLHQTVIQLLLITPPTQTPMAISSLYIGEHVPEEVLKDICGWATACIQRGMTPKQFKDVWNRLLEEEDEELEETLGRNHNHYWLDVTEWGEGDLYELYANAVQNGGDRFTWFDNNSFIDIVATRGKPTNREIANLVLSQENSKSLTEDDINENFLDANRYFYPLDFYSPTR
ncbi:MAG: WGR domain-containing protein [Candidatus Yanofskybacteria bacterium]|nr:WGR domain-containing protein [Candidatus Yanofskybacteria bacterium]